MNQNNEWVVLRSLTEQIKRCDDQGLTTPSVAMCFICIDAMASLARPSGKDKVTRNDFIEWCDKYLKPTSLHQQYHYSGVDIYAARCALIHTYGTTAELHEKPNVVKFLYHDLQSLSHDVYAEDNIVVISTKSLVMDVCKAVESFITECESTSSLKELVLSRTDEVITVAPYSARS